MSWQTPFTRPVKTIVFYFLALSAVAIAVAAAQRTGVVGSLAEKRLLGLVVGIMAVAMGNFLPKVRPLQGVHANAAQAMAAERFAGWALVLVGIAYIVLFTFFPLNQARQLSGTVGISAILLIAARWIWFASRGAACVQQPIDTTIAVGSRSAEKQRLLAFLLFAFLWVLASASAAFLLGNKSWFGRFGFWMTTAGFWLLYAALAAFLDYKRPLRTHKSAR